MITTSKKAGYFFFCFFLTFSLLSCGKKKSNANPIVFSGALYAHEEGNEKTVVLLSNRQSANTFGISSELSEKIFSATIIECRNAIKSGYFYCYNSASCTNSCIVRSARADGTDERVEEKDDENKVNYLWGRIYWCPCE